MILQLRIVYVLLKSISRVVKLKHIHLLKMDMEPVLVAVLVTVNLASIYQEVTSRPIVRTETARAMAPVSAWGAFTNMEKKQAMLI